jgi:biotin operon repressor
MNQLTLEFTDEDKQRAATLADRVLNALKSGPKLSSELKEISHRFSASIRVLRERGYSIAVERVGESDFLHRLESYTPLDEVTDEMKAAYYETYHWKSTRASRMEFDDYRCCHCRSEKNLQVHHWVYELFAEPLEDLVTLCEECHTRIHEYAAVKCHFPHYVSQEIAEKLQGVKSAQESPR